MKSRSKALFHQEFAQALLEFALIVPLLLLIVYGLIEFGRLMAIYSMLTTASREGARYGAAAGDVGEGIPHYADCDGIRAAAKKQAMLVNLQDADIEIAYDRGPGTSVSVGCPPLEDIHLGDRVIIKVEGYFEPLVQIVNIPAIMIRLKTARTILKDVTIVGTLPAPESTNTGTPPPTSSPTITDTPTTTSTPTPTPPQRLPRPIPQRLQRLSLGCHPQRPPRLPHLHQRIHSHQPAHPPKRLLPRRYVRYTTTIH